MSAAIALFDTDNLIHSTNLIGDFSLVKLPVIWIDILLLGLLLHLFESTEASNEALRLWMLGF